MTVANNDIVRATVSFDIGGDSIAQNVYHFKYTGSGDTDDEILTAVAAHLNAAMTGFEDELADTVASLSIYGWRWDGPVLKWTGIGFDAFTSIVGTDVNEMLPHGAAPKIRFSTPDPKRIGAKYIAGVVANELLDGNPAVTLIAALGVMGLLLNNDRATANGSLSPGSFDWLNEIFSAWGENVLVPASFSYQRRRRPGVGLT